MLLAMASARLGALFEPVRIQKLLFMIDREIPGAVGGPWFDFRPYRYGPFDRAVYDELRALSRAGRVTIHEGPTRRAYALTAAGLAKGRAMLQTLPPEIRRYLAELTKWVLSQRFAGLLTAIYRKYPEMATKSVARGVISGSSRRSRRLPDAPFLQGMETAFDLSGAYWPTPRDRKGHESDVEALREDWRAVGDDLRRAMAQFSVAREGEI